MTCPEEVIGSGLAEGVRLPCVLDRGHDGGHATAVTPLGIALLRAEREDNADPDEILWVAPEDSTVDQL